MENNELLKNVRDNIKMIRVKRGLSQNDVADKLGICRQAYSIWENHSKDVSLYRLYSLTKVLNCEITDFFINI